MELTPSQASGGAATAARHGSGVVIGVRVSMENDRIMFLVNQSGSTKAFLLGPTRITGGGGRRGVRNARESALRPECVDDDIIIRRAPDEEAASWQMKLNKGVQ